MYYSMVKQFNNKQFQKSQFNFQQKTGLFVVPLLDYLERE